MVILKLVITLFILIIIGSAFFNLKLSVALYMSYLILVPYMEFNIGINVSYNFVNLILLGVFILKNNKNKIQLDILKPYAFLMIGFLLLMPFQELSIKYQFHNWFSGFMNVMTVVVLSYNLILRDSKALAYFKTSLLVSMVICLLYGLALTQMGGFNPYVAMVHGALGVDNELKEAVEGRAFSYGYTSSTFGHAMEYGMYLIISFYFVLSLFGNDKKYNKRLYILVALALLNLVLCGVRSAMVALFVSFIYFLVANHKGKMIFAVLFFALICYCIINSNEVLSEHFNSMNINNTDNVTGSSIDARLMQLKGTFNEIKDCFLIGKGYCWHQYYMSIHKTHPTILAFESLIFVALCNGGIIGLLLWILFIINTMRFNKRNLQREQYITLNSMLLGYFAYVCVTGDYGYLKFFMIMYCVAYGNLITENKICTTVKNM